MTRPGILQVVVLFGLIFALTKPVGAYVANVLEGKRTFLHPFLRWLEVLVYKAAGIREEVEQRWTQYTAALLSFSFAGFLLAYLIQRVQGVLPLNPQHFGARNVTPDLAFNSALSFVSNTNWQAYSGESTLSYFVQMAVLTVQDFASPAAGLAVAIAVVRGFARQGARTIGNFWVDVTRTIIYVLLPISIVASLCLSSQGVIQNLKPYTDAAALDGGTQVIAQGPVASQEAIKQLGNNGSGFFNANSAHPFENPTPLTNFVEMLLLMLLPAGLTYTFGRMVGDTRQGWALFAAFVIVSLIGVYASNVFEQSGNPVLAKYGVESPATIGQPGGNMEGKEQRFGIATSALFTTITTTTACGAMISSLDSLTPLGGLVPLFNIATGEVFFGGVGSGLYGVLLYCILAVFIAGLMVGRTPEYLGKKIEQKEVKMAMLALIPTAASILLFSAITSVVELKTNGYWNPAGAPVANLNNHGPHGFSEIFYAYMSATTNQGSAFAGLNANTPWYNLSLAAAFMIGRYVFLIPMLAAAGSLALKRKVPVTSGTLPTHGPMFVVLLIGTIVLISALTYFPALSLGPIVEHSLMQAGKLFP